MRTRGATEKRILEAAGGVFARRGTAGARMDEIARDARVNQALLHYYFRSKQRLADEAFQMMAGRILHPLIESLGSDLSLEEKSRQVVALCLEAFSENPFLPGYLLSELHHHPARASQLLDRAIGAAGSGAPHLMETMRREIDDAVAAGQMRRISPEQFIVTLVSLCVFPFAARSMFSVILGFDDSTFARFLESGKTDLPAFFRHAIRP